MGHETPEHTEVGHGSPDREQDLSGGDAQIEATDDPGTDNAE